MYLAPHVRLTWGGSLYGQDDVWQNNLRIANPHVVGGKMNITDYQASSLLFPMFAAFKSPLGLLHEDVRIDYVRLSLIDVDGKVMDTMTYELDSWTGRDLVAEIRYPPQVAMVLSLKSDAVSRSARNGRLYIPTPNISLDRHGLLDKDLVQDIAQHYAFMIRGINQALSQFWPQAYVALVSDRGEGAQGRVVSVHAGRLLDVMGRRKNNFQELYADKQYVATATFARLELLDEMPDFLDQLNDLFWDEFVRWVAAISGVTPE